MELRELIEIVKGRLLNDYQDIDITGFSTDTRKLDGEVYIALRGKNYDGHKFINNDLKASVVISEQDIVLDDIPVIKVKDNYDTLYYLSKYFISKYNVPVIAITGSNGKTTLKELIYDILSINYKVLKNPDNTNNIIGLFNTLKQLDNSYDLCVLEMGMNHDGEISKLSNMTNPSKAFITNIGKAHLGNFKKKKDIFMAKMEIIDGLKGDLIVNGDDKYLKKIKAYKCGCEYYNDLMAYNIKVYQDLLTFNIYLDKEYLITFKIPSKYYVNTILEAIKCGLDYHIDIQDIIKCLSDFKPIDHRLQIIKINDYYLIDDTYNASYESVKCGIDYLKRIPNDKIIIIADILELGKYSKKYHKRINQLLRKLHNKEVLTVGYYTKYIKGIHFNNNDKLMNYLNNQDLTNKYLYLKGSHRMNLEEIVKKCQVDK